MKARTLCRTQQRDSRAVCTGLLKGHSGPHNFILPDGVTAVPKAKRVDPTTLKVATLISAILEEPYDNIDEPHPVRLDQARDLLMCWSSSRYAVVGMLREVLNLKRGYCVRCVADPCPDCGADSRLIKSV